MKDFLFEAKDMGSKNEDKDKYLAKKQGQG